MSDYLCMPRHTSKVKDRAESDQGRWKERGRSKARQLPQITDKLEGIFAVFFNKNMTICNIVYIANNYTYANTCNYDFTYWAIRPYIVMNN